MAWRDPQPDRPDLDVLLAEWQPLLRLADWDILVSFKRHLSRCSVSFDHHYKHACISMVDPIDWPEDATRPYDVEKFFVHELCHLHLAELDIPNDTPAHGAEERACESLARAFVALKRRRKAPES